MSSQTYSFTPRTKKQFLRAPKKWRHATQTETMSATAAAVRPEKKRRKIVPILLAAGSTEPSVLSCAMPRLVLHPLAPPVPVVVKPDPVAPPGPVTVEADSVTVKSELKSELKSEQHVRESAPPEWWTYILTSRLSALESSLDSTSQHEERLDLLETIEELRNLQQIQWFQVKDEMIWTLVCHLECALGLWNGTIKKSFNTPTREVSPVIRKGDEFFMQVPLVDLQQAGYDGAAYHDRRRSPHPLRQLISFDGVEEFLFGSQRVTKDEVIPLPPLVPIATPEWKEILQDVKGPGIVIVPGT